MPDTPITTEPLSPAFSSAMSAMRSAIIFLGPFAIARGWTDQGGLESLLNLIAAGGAAAAAAYAAYKNFKHASALKAAAPLVPNTIIASR